jgi:hypothetical protein
VWAGNRVLDTLSIGALKAANTAKAAIRHSPHQQPKYKRLEGIIKDAQRAGLIDWAANVDRTRNVRTHTAWDEPR